MTTSPPDDLGISDTDATAISRYLKSRNTAVLTVMFTDIQGFTRITEERGEEYSRDLRQHHDVILRDAIERDGSGLIIKFIGDAVMAVFSEPSAAVESSLLVQERIRAFNAEHPQLEDLLVRIGLHMGQVAVEDTLQTDVFGRHVNRAARVESLASGGQIFMSDPVFDSARGWLGSREHLAWTAHGRYAVKGIPKPVEIYEVCDSRAVSPRPPHARRVRNVPRLATAAVLVLLGALAAVAAMLYERTEVWMMRPYPEGLRLNSGERVLLEGMPGDERRRVTTALAPGRILLRYDVAAGVRYYAELDIERGENVLEARYQESRLPGISVRAGVRDSPSAEASRTRRFDFMYYDAEDRRRQQRGELQVEVRSHRDAGDDGLAHHEFHWRIERDGEALKEGVVTTRHRIGDATERVAPVVLVEQPPFAWYYRYYTIKEFAEFTLGAAFSESLAGKR